MNYSEYMTLHSCKRIQQRGTKLEWVELLLEYGETMFHNGGEVVYVNHKALERLERLSISRQVIEKLKRLYLVICDGKVVTVAKKIKHFKRDL